MLVLTRRPGEQIVIGNGIRVTVVSVGPGRVKLGVEAPANVRIDRQEIHDRIQHERSVDVLAAVGDLQSPTQGSETSHLIESGSVTDTQIHNRIAAVIEPDLADGNSAMVAGSPAANPVNRLTRERLPRRSR